MEELICLPRFSVSSGEGSKTPAFPDRMPSDWLRGTLAATEAPLLPPRGGSPATGIGGRFRARHQCHRLRRHRVRRVTEHRRARVQHASLGGSLLPWRTEPTGPPGTSSNPSAVHSCSQHDGAHRALRPPEERRGRLFWRFIQSSDQAMPTAEGAMLLRALPSVPGPFAQASLHSGLPVRGSLRSHSTPPTSNFVTQDEFLNLSESH